jgi:hypothetical protein
LALSEKLVLDNSLKQLAQIFLAAIFALAPAGRLVCFSVSSCSRLLLGLDSSGLAIEQFVEEIESSVH